MGKLSENLKNLLSSNMDQLAIDNRAKLNFLQTNAAIKTSLMQILLPHFPAVEIYLFGSRIIGTGSGTSDLDIYVDIDQTYYTLAFDRDVTHQLASVHKLLSNFSNEWCDLKIVGTTKIPLIKAVFRQENIHCDISFSDGIGHRNTMLIKTLCDQQPIYRDMIIILRLWMEEAELCNEFSNYTLRLLVLNYLQSVSVLPPIKMLQDNMVEPLEIGPWNVDFDVSKLQNFTNSAGPQNLRSHIKGYFKYYGSSNIVDNIICTYLGSLVPKNILMTNQAKSFQRYYNYVNTYRGEMYQLSNMNVQGPLHLAQNPSRNVSVKALKKFIHLTQDSFQLMNM